MIYNTIYIGFGPATIFSIIRFPIKNSLVIEKGKDIRNRDDKEVLYGSGGAGAYSDSKLVNNPLVGGDLKSVTNISDEQFYNLADQILEYYYQFYSKQTFNWIPEDPYEIPSDKLKLLKSKVCHIGTNRSKEIFQNIESYVRNFVPINFEEEVISIIPNLQNTFTITTNKSIYQAKNVVVGVGKRSSLVNELIGQLKLKSKNNLTQIGVRVEIPNTYLKDLVSKFYDFKIVMNTKLGRWRTFCCCGKNAYITVEKCKEFVSANGAASEGNNGILNFGLMGELNLDLDRTKQIELMQKVNNGTNKLLAQNIDDFIKIQDSKELNYITTVPKEDYRLDNLWKYYPLDVLNELQSFIIELKKHFEFDGHFMAPEIKMTTPIIEMNQNFEIYPNLFLIGDCSGHSRGIIQAGIIGMLVGNELTKRK